MASSTRRSNVVLAKGLDRGNAAPSMGRHVRSFGVSPDIT